MTFESRITVSAEIFNTSAVSSTLRPIKAKLDDLALPWVFTGQRLERPIDRDQVFRRLARDRKVLVERHALELAAALLVVVRPRKVDDHFLRISLGGHREAMCMVLPVDAPNVNQLNVDLVDKRRGLKHVAGRSPAMCCLAMRRSSPCTSGSSLSTAP